jgi:hypothetical protein
MSIKDYEGISFGVIESTPWKHTVLRWVATLLYFRKADYVLVLHDNESNK